VRSSIAVDAFFTIGKIDKLRLSAIAAPLKEPQSQSCSEMRLLSSVRARD
jgi:hypothetical protein